LFATSAILLALTQASAQAKLVLDVTPTADTTLSGTAAIGGNFIVQNTNIQPTGTGNIDPFLTIHQTGQESGYNTDQGLPLDTQRPAWTNGVQLKNTTVVTVGGVQYLEFLVDVNQVANGPISLNQVQFFVSNAQLGASTSDYTLTSASQGTGPTGVGGADPVISFGSAATEVFRMNFAENNGTSLASNYEVQIDSAHGSGSGDMFLYVQASLFGNNGNSYITLFSQFGHPSGTYESTSGFEEWAFREGNGPTLQSVPEPSTIVAAFAGLVPFGVVGLLRRRRAKSTSN